MKKFFMDRILPFIIVALLCVIVLLVVTHNSKSETFSSTGIMRDYTNTTDTVFFYTGVMQSRFDAQAVWIALDPSASGSVTIQRSRRPPNSSWNYLHFMDAAGSLVLGPGESALTTAGSINAVYFVKTVASDELYISASTSETPDYIEFINTPEADYKKYVYSLGTFLAQAGDTLYGEIFPKSNLPDIRGAKSVCLWLSWAACPFDSHLRIVLAHGFVNTPTDTIGIIGYKRPSGSAHLVSTLSTGWTSPTTPPIRPFQSIVMRPAQYQRSGSLMPASGRLPIPLDPPYAGNYCVWQGAAYDADFLPKAPDTVQTVTMTLEVIR